MLHAVSKRPRRVAELIQSVIADLLIKSVHDPRLKFTHITHVNLSSDFNNATVYFSLPDTVDDAVAQAEKAFKKASGFFRSELSKAIELRHTPKLIFQYDKTHATAQRIADLLKGS